MQIDVTPGGRQFGRQDRRAICALASVADAKPELVAALAAGGNIALDLSELGECDTAGIQLLLMACASARAKGRRLQTIGQTAVVPGGARPARHSHRMLRFQPRRGTATIRHR